MGELSTERAALARAQREKAKVETRLREVHLGQALSGGVIPTDKGRQLVWGVEVLIINTIAQMVVDVPKVYFETDQHAGLTDQVYRLRLIMNPWPLQARDEFRNAAENLLSH